MIHHHGCGCGHQHCPNCGYPVPSYPYGIYPWYPYQPWVYPKPYIHWVYPTRYEVTTTVTYSDPARAAVNALAGAGKVA